MSDLMVRKNDMMPFFVADQAGPTGFENIDNDCISIPFFRLAQSNTPQVSNPQQHLDGLKAGMYFSPSTGRVYGNEVKVIILGFFRNFTVWEGDPPNAKFVTALSPEDYAKNYEPHVHQQEKPLGGFMIVDEKGHRYVDTRNFFVLTADSPEDGVQLYAMTSTGIPASKKWLAKASAVRVSDADGNLLQAPMWSRIWTPKVTFVGKKGGYYQVTDIVDGGWIDEAMVPVVKAAFEEVLAYDKSRIAAVDKAAVDE